VKEAATYKFLIAYTFDYLYQFVVNESSWRETLDDGRTDRRVSCKVSRGGRCERKEKRKWRH